MKDIIGIQGGGNMKKHHFPSFGKKNKATVGFDVKPFDPETQYAAIRSSICTGEKVAGFRDKSGGHFTEIMLIRSPEDVKRFCEQYGVDDIKTEY